MTPAKIQWTFLTQARGVTLRIFFSAVTKMNEMQGEAAQKPLAPELKTKEYKKASDHFK